MSRFVRSWKITRLEVAAPGLTRTKCGTTARSGARWDADLRGCTGHPFDLRRLRVACLGRSLRS
jgi:hypothetical protein